jgi:hypothetical protein
MPRTTQQDQIRSQLRELQRRRRETETAYSQALADQARVLDSIRRECSHPELGPIQPNEDASGHDRECLICGRRLTATLMHGKPNGKVRRDEKGRG